MNAFEKFFTEHGGKFVDVTPEKEDARMNTVYDPFWVDRFEQEFEQYSELFKDQYLKHLLDIEKVKERWVINQLIAYLEKRFGVPESCHKMREEMIDDVIRYSKEICLFSERNGFPVKMVDTNTGESLEIKYEHV